MPRMHDIVSPNGRARCRAHQRAVVVALGKYYLVGRVVRPRHVMLVGITHSWGRITVYNAHRLTMRVGMVKHGRILPMFRAVTPPPVHRPVQHGDWPHVMFRHLLHFLIQRAHMNLHGIAITGRKH